MSQINILLAEDDLYSAKLVNDFLSIHGYHVFCFQDGLSVLEEIQNLKVDLALLDLRLPGKNGFLIAEFLRNNPLFTSLPIIITSAFTDQQNKIRAYEAGANYFISKPINTKELYFIIKNLLNQQQAKINQLQLKINQLIEKNLGRNNHTNRVIDHCRQLAQIQGLIHEDRDNLLLAAAFHDLGLTNPNNQEKHESLSVQIATEMGLNENVLALIRNHHQISETELRKFPQSLKLAVKIIQTAEKIEENYIFSIASFQEDLKKGRLQPEFISYIGDYLKENHSQTKV